MPRWPPVMFVSAIWRQRVFAKRDRLPFRSKATLNCSRSQPCRLSSGQVLPRVETPSANRVYQTQA